MESKYKLISCVLLIVFLFFSTCKTSDNRAQKSYNQMLNKKAVILPSEWNFGKDIEIDTTIAFSHTGIWSETLNEFYATRSYEAAWLNNRKLNRNGEELFDVFNSIWRDGIYKERYNCSYLENKVEKYEQLATGEKDSLHYATILDIELTNAFFKLADDMANGQINPADVDTIWQTYPKHSNLTSYLSEAVDNNDVEYAIKKLMPKTEQYLLLKRAYARLLETSESENWSVPGFFEGKMEEGDSGMQVILIKEFLVTAGDLEIKDTAYVRSQVFDSVLTQAVQGFQQRHGLKADGIVGKATLAEMNQPLAKRLGQLRVNLDRLRNFPEDLGKEYIAINIPGYSLEYIKDNKRLNKMNVVVGSNRNATPVLKDTLSYIVFNPEWNVPNSIATKEILPKAKADSTFITRNNYKVIPYTGAKPKVDWSEVSASNFPYRIVQKSGGSNALGRVKFIMPNQYAIYLHDTPAKTLFAKSKRNLSHGCIRLSQPFKLAKNLLEDQLADEEIEEIIASREMRKIFLEEQIPVHMFYHTAWVDNEGKLQFREDIYNHDQLALVKMKKYTAHHKYEIFLAENK